MDDTEVKIIVAATDVITKYGVHGTKMAGIAKAAGVSRQTLYAHFRTKDDLLNAVYKQGSIQILAKLETQWASCKTASQVLDVYVQVVTLKSFELFQKHPDLASFFEARQGPRGALVNKAQTDLSNALALRFTRVEFKSHDGFDTGRIAAYVVHVTKELKLSCNTLDDLNNRLEILKASVLALRKSQ